MQWIKLNNKRLFPNYLEWHAQVNSSWSIACLLHIFIHLLLHTQSPITVITTKWLLCASVLFSQNWRLLALIYSSGNANPVICCLPLCRVLDTTSHLTRAYVAWAPSVTKSWRLVHIWSSNGCSVTKVSLFLSRVGDAIVNWCVSHWQSGRSSSVF